MPLVVVKELLAIEERTGDSHALIHASEVTNKEGLLTAVVNKHNEIRGNADLQPPSPAFFSPALIGIGLTLILLTVILMGVRHTSGSREASGATVLTIAAVILLSGVWSMWLSPTFDTRRHQEITLRSLSIDALGSMIQSFDAKAGQEIQVNIESIRPPIIVTVPGKGDQPVFPVYSVKIYDPTGKLLWSQANVSGHFLAQLSPIKESGSFRVEVSNSQKEAINLTLRVLDITKTTIRPLEPLGQYLTLISLPIFGLGIWSARHRKLPQEPPQT